VIPAKRDLQVIAVIETDDETLDFGVEPRRRRTAAAGVAARRERQLAEHIRARRQRRGEVQDELTFTEAARSLTLRLGGKIDVRKSRDAERRVLIGRLRWRCYLMPLPACRRHRRDVEQTGEQDEAQQWTSQERHECRRKSSDCI
jgi:hypothetical protein